jgi:hypothetical protein
MHTETTRLLGRQIGRIMTDVELELVSGASNGCGSRGPHCSTYYETVSQCVCDVETDMYDCDRPWDAMATTG